MGPSISGGRSTSDPGAQHPGVHQPQPVLAFSIAHRAASTNVRCETRLVKVCLDLTDLWRRYTYHTSSNAWQGSTRE